MLSKSKYSVVFKAISIILLQAFFVSSVSFALAPPSEFEDTGKAFMNRTASAYVLRILAKYLSLGISDHTAKEITQAAIDEILKKAGKPEINLSKTRGDLDPFLYGFELDELEYRESENAYYLPIYRDNGKTLFQHYKFYVDGNDKDADMRISLPGGKFVYVDAIRYDERAEIAARSMRHGKQWYFDVAKATKSMSQLLELLIPEEKSVLKTTLTKLYERLSSVQKNIHELLNSPSKDYADIIISYQDNLVELEAIQIALFRTKKDINSRRYKSPRTEEDKREILEAVLGCVQETIDILTNKIEFSKGKKGTCKTENVGKLLREDDKYIGQFVTEAEDVHVRDINALRLLEALENLLNNADEYGDATLREVSVREADGFCEIEVRDNGKGIDPSLLVEGSIPGRLKLFELGTTTREDGREGGLGTAIVWHFVQDHGGTIDVESLTEEEYKAVTPGDKNIETPISQRSKAYLNENHSVFSARMKELLATTEKLIHKISTDTMLKPDELKSIKKMLLSGNIRDTLRLFEVWETTTHDVFSYPGYFAHVGANITQVLLVEIDKIDAAGGKVSKALGEKIIQALAETRAKILRYNKFLDRIVQNKRITPGTTFTIRLPIGKEKTSENTETPHVPARLIRVHGLEESEIKDFFVTEGAEEKSDDMGTFAGDSFLDFKRRADETIIDDDDFERNEYFFAADTYFFIGGGVHAYLLRVATSLAKHFDRPIAIKIILNECYPYPTIEKLLPYCYREFKRDGPKNFKILHNAKETPYRVEGEGSIVIFDFLDTYPRIASAKINPKPASGAGVIAGENNIQISRELLFEWSYDQETASSFESKLGEALNVKHSLRGFYGMWVACCELASNIIKHGKSGRIEIYSVTDASGLEKIEAIGIDNGPGIGGGINALVRQSIMAHRTGEPEKRGFKYISFSPHSITVETTGRKYVRFTRDEHSDKWYQDVGPTDVKRGTRFTLEFIKTTPSEAANQATGAAGIPTPKPASESRRDSSAPDLDEIAHDELMRSSTSIADLPEEERIAARASLERIAKRFGARVISDTEHVARKEPERIQATKLMDTVKLINAKKQTKPRIFLLGSSWIKAYERYKDKKFRYLQGQDLNKLITSITGLSSEDGINFIVDEDDALLGRLSKIEGYEDAEVVVLAGEETIKSDAFKTLRDNKDNTLVGVNNEYLSIDNYIRLVEMVNLTLKLATGMNVNMDNPNIKITPITDPDGNVLYHIFTPRAEPMNYEELKEIYRVQIFA